MFHHSVRKHEKKLSVIAQLSNFMSLNQRRTLMKTFKESQFGYCPLIWMFHGRTVNKKTTCTCFYSDYDNVIQIKNTNLGGDWLVT